MAELGPFTRAQRVLAAILPYYQRSDDWTVPRAVTQDGIGETLDLSIVSVSKALRWLEDNGLVAKKRRYVEGMSANHHRFWTYLPTWNGLQYMKMVEKASGYKAKDIPFIPAERTSIKVHFNDPMRMKMEKLDASVKTEREESNIHAI